MRTTHSILRMPTLDPAALSSSSRRGSALGHIGTGDSYQFPQNLSRRSSLTVSRTSQSSSRRGSHQSTGDLPIDPKELAARRYSMNSDRDPALDFGPRTSFDQLQPGRGAGRPSDRAAAGTTSSLKIWDVVLRRLRSWQMSNDHLAEQGRNDYFQSNTRSSSIGSPPFSPVGTPLATPGGTGSYGTSHYHSDPFSFDDTTLVTVMDAHLKAIANSFSPITLTFHDPDVESTYERYFLDRTLCMWRKSVIISMLATAVLETILVALYTQPNGMTTPLKDFILVGAFGVLPMAIIIALGAWLPLSILAKHIHTLSLLVVWIIGPVITCGRYFITDEPRYSAAFTAPIYIFELVACVFFFRLRFMHTLFGVFVVAVPLWLVVAAISLVNDRVAGGGTGRPEREFAFASVAVCLASLVICFIAYDTERNIRLQYLSDQRFLSINVKLRRQLKGLQKGFESRIADLDSPLEKAIYGLRALMGNPSLDAEHLKSLTMIMSCLSVPNLFAPDLDQQVKRGQVEVDDEQEKWLFTQLARRKNLNGESSSADTSPREQTAAILIPTTTSQPLENASPSTSGFVPEPINIQEYYSEDTQELLVKLNEYNFPIFAFEEACRSRPLLVMSHHLVVRSGLLGRLQLPVDKFINFMSEIEKGYNPHLTFHNSIHATDVLHCIHYLISLPRLRTCFTDVEVLAFYIAAAIHDYDHPGVNNHFLIATSDPRALLYNDKSVLENHHCASAFQVMRKPECDFAAGMVRKEYRGLREGIVEMVLATDLAQHFSLLAMFKKKVLTSGGFDPVSTREDRTLLMQMLMKCSDVSNPTKAWPIYHTWIQRITEEFFCQGDREKALGLPISPFCNRDGAKGADPRSSQKSFIEFIVAPLIEAVGEWVELGIIRDGLEDSRIRFGGVGNLASGANTPTKGNNNTMPPLSPLNDRAGIGGVALRRNKSVPEALAHLTPEALAALNGGPISTMNHSDRRPSPLHHHRGQTPLRALFSDVTHRRRESWAGSLVGVGEAVVARFARRGSADAMVGPPAGNRSGSQSLQTLNEPEAGSAETSPCTTTSNTDSDEDSNTSEPLVIAPPQPSDRV
ncbi:uncharacterized protein EV422DRAFT_386421 [Fimicolochytrium jonesii]|uniref:uncharacterized protein n=1 Tax=Fimicolochytrium jonesii TaxID=1396493 RepID=UPI0022FDCEB4|nr:uncharacterized protein EV422DRAFT_386421 [Fimicolochytrium jonesii]KAI8822965.1 hypothetical protein EV422DRAFT_386421 [Fimicolochytrium jonesii]